LHDEVCEYRELLNSGYPLPGFSGPADLKKSLDYSSTEGWMLPALKIAAVGELLDQSEKTKKSISSAEESNCLKAIVGDIKIFQELKRSIFRSVNKMGEILDSASTDLGRIRRQVRKTRDRLRSRLENMAADFHKQGVLQDPFFTIRNDRFVLPVRAGAGKAVKGIVHDRSSSGATMFVEPQSVVTTNNQISNLLADEKKEEKRILKELTARVGEHAEAIECIYKIMIHLDIIRAKSRMANEMKATCIEVKRGPFIDLRQCRNPLLILHRAFHTGEKAGTGPVVPIDISIGEDSKILVITGPNTGGKTVALKSIGLSVLMIQSGIPPVCSEESTLGVFKDIFADIGDEQSLQQSLSTFSAHLKQIGSMLDSADKDSLILLDELGAGTDPAEGSALGITILDELKERKATTIATTHHNSIKAFAFTTKGIENAAMEFDTRTFEPTYRILMGRIGQSNALAIAARLGFPKSLLERAKTHLAGKTEDLEKLLNVVERERTTARKIKVRADNERSRAKELRKAREDVLRKAEKDAEIILGRAADQSEKLILKLRKQQESMKEVLKQLKSSSKKKGQSPVSSKIELSRKLADVLHQAEAEANSFRHPAGLTEEEGWTGGPPEEGTMVLLNTFNKKGRVKKYSGSDKITVDMAGKRIVVPLTGIRRLAKDQQEDKVESTGCVTVHTEPVEPPPLRLMLIGKRVDEAMDVLELYLDRVARVRLPEVTIVHGFGTGRLQDAVVKFLKKSPYVSRARRGTDAEGGGGVTVVEMKSQDQV